MSYNLFVGGLPYEISQDELAKLFGACGAVTSCKLIMDRDTGRSKGFGFVEMATEAEARAAIAKLNGSSVGERTIFVNEARPQEKRPDAFGDKSGFAAKPGFVERRSGKDRRQSSAGPGAPSGERKWGDKPAWVADRRPSAGGPQKKAWGDKPAWSKDKPAWSKDKPAWSKDKPDWKKDKPAWSKDKPAWSKDKPAWSKDKPAWKKDKPAWSKDKPWGADKPSAPSSAGEKKWGDKPAWKKDKPAWSKDKPAASDADKKWGEKGAWSADKRPAGGSTGERKWGEKPAWKGPGTGGAGKWAGKPRKPGGKPGFGPKKGFGGSGPKRGGERG